MNCIIRMSCVFYVLIFLQLRICLIQAQNLYRSVDGFFAQQRSRGCGGASLTCIKQSRICPSEFCYGRLFSRCACSQGLSSSLRLFSAVTMVFRCLSLRGSLVCTHIKQPHPCYSFSSLTVSRKMPQWLMVLCDYLVKNISVLREKKKS